MRPAWSWAESASEAEEFQAEANGLVGETIARVRYINLDYSPERFGGDDAGPRDIEDDSEWESPTWRHPACDSVDFGVEIEVVSGRRFTVSYESPGRREGIGLRQLSALGTAVSEDFNAAVWDVTGEPGWRAFVDQQVRTVTLHYEPWDETAALWCRWITLEAGPAKVEFLLAEGGVDKPAEPSPSADNVAVLFHPYKLPSWLRFRQP